MQMLIEHIVRGFRSRQRPDRTRRQHPRHSSLTRTTTATASITFFHLLLAVLLLSFSKNLVNANELSAEITGDSLSSTSESSAPFAFSAAAASSTSSVNCRFPGAPAHSYVTFSNDSLTTGTVATYSCERGFELLGPIRRICINGQWSPEGIPFCVLNVAAGKAPMQISIDRGGIPQKAIDGSTSLFFNNFTCSLTKPEINPWLYVNLLEPYMVQLVRLDFGMSCCGPNKPATIVVRVGNNRPDLGTNPICNRFTGYLEERQPLFLPCNPPMPGAFVSIHLETSTPHPLSICEAFVYTDQALPIERCPIFRDQPPGSTATYNGKCYIFYNQQPKSFRSALEFCRARGGTLVDESNPALQGFISWELWRRHRGDIRSQYWIGSVRDSKNKNNWKWVNGDDVTVSFWSSPLPGKDDCARYDGSKGWLWSEINCNANLSFICQHQPKACGRPEQPPNSTMIITNSNVGANIEYSCDEGHALVGPAVRKCLDTGFYNEFPPICKYIQCGYPSEIVNGAYELVNNSIGFLSNAIYRCDEGYRMVGESLLMCDFDERWNSPPPKCEIVDCEEPEPIRNGYYKKINNSTIFGSTIEYSCKMDYKLIGNSRLTCAANGQYEPQLPKCSEVVTTPIAKPKPATTKSSAQPPTITSTKSKITKWSTTVGVKQQTDRASSPPSSSSPTTQRPSFTNTISDDSPSLHPNDNLVEENSINSRYDNAPNINVPQLNDLNRSPPPYGARFNMGVIIALGIFGSFLFLAAIVTTLVVLLRKKNGAKHFRHRSSPDCRTVDSFDSSSSESRNGGLNRFYRQAWENLHESASSKAGLKSKSNYNLNGGGNGNHHPGLKRKDTLDEPYRNGERHRDGSELIVSESKNFSSSKNNLIEKKRHHHHHHHHNNNTSNNESSNAIAAANKAREWKEAKSHLNNKRY